MFWFRPLFMFELLFAQGMFAFKLERRQGFFWKLPLSVAVCFAFSFLVPYESKGIAEYLFVFFFLFALTLVVGLFLFDAPLKNLVICAVAGYTAQHIASELYEIFNVVMGVVAGSQYDFYATELSPISASNYFFLIIYAFIYVLTYTVVGLVVVRLAEKYKVMQTGSFTIMVLSSLILFIDVVVSSVVTYALPSDLLSAAFIEKEKWRAGLAQGLLHFYNFLCCLLVFTLLVELPRRYEAEAENYVLKQMRGRKKEQYQMAKESVEVINLKCHDLKHRMYAVFDDKKFDDEERSEISRAIDIYDSSFHTDSEAFNVTLTEKSLVCKSKGVELSCIADAAALSFMKDYDVYSLFGNLMDNAIEATSELEKERRSISLKVTARGSLTLIKIFNTFKGPLDFKNDLPVTTKRDKVSHGYGLKSVKHIVEKYGGNMSIKVKDDVFSVTILFLPPPRKNR